MTNKPTPASQQSPVKQVEQILLGTKEQYQDAVQPPPARSDKGAELIFQARSPEGDPWQEVSADDFIKASANGYETRLHLAWPGQNSVFYEVAGQAQKRAPSGELPQVPRTYQQTEKERAAIEAYGKACIAASRSATAGTAAIEGRTVSVDVSTSEEDAGNRIFAQLTGETGSDGTTLLAYEVSRNFAGTTAAPTDATSAAAPGDLPAPKFASVMAIADEFGSGSTAYTADEVRSILVSNAGAAPDPQKK